MYAIAAEVGESLFMVKWVTEVDSADSVDINRFSHIGGGTQYTFNTSKSHTPNNEQLADNKRRVPCAMTPTGSTLG